MLKLNYIENSLILGYPIIKHNLNDICPIPELLSYEGFIEQIYGVENLKNNFYFKCANNQLYNYWMPIYLNANNFILNKTIILNSFSIIKNGYIGKKEYDFKPEYIFEILPYLLNNMIINMSKNRTKISESFIRCFFHFIFLFKNLFQLFKRGYRKYINNYLDKFLIEIKKEYNTIDESIFTKLNHLFILLLFSNEDNNCKEMEKTQKCLSIIRNLIINKLCLELFNKNKKFIMNYPNKFIEDLNKYNIFNKLVNIVCSDSQNYIRSKSNNIISKRLRRKMSNKINDSFKELYIWCNHETKNKLNEIILKNLNFSDYFSFDEYLNYLIEKIIESQLPDSFGILIIFFYWRKKIKDFNFMKNLEKDYCIYLDAKNSIKEIFNIIDEIYKFKDLYLYINKKFDKALIEIYALLYCLNNLSFLENIESEKKDNKLDSLYLYFDEIKTNLSPRKIINIYRVWSSRFNAQFKEKINFRIECYYNKISLKICFLLTILLTMIKLKYKYYLFDFWTYFKFSFIYSNFTIKFRFKFFNYNYNDIINNYRKKFLNLKKESDKKVKFEKRIKENKKYKKFQNKYFFNIERKRVNKIGFKKGYR